LAGISEHLIKILVKSESGSGPVHESLDVSSISNAVESTISASIKSMEASIGDTLSKALTTATSANSKNPSDNSGFVRTLTKEIKGSIVEIVNKSASGELPTSSVDIRKEVTSAIESILTKKLEGYFKANNVDKTESASKKVIKSVSSSISSAELSGIAKVAQELSGILKQLSVITGLLTKNTTDSTKDSTSVTSTTVENIIGSKKLVKIQENQTKVVSNVGTADYKGASSELSKLNAKYAKLQKDLESNVELTVVVNTDQAEKDIAEFTKNQAAVIDVDVDTTGAQSKIDKVLTQDPLFLNIDLQNEDITSIFDKISNIQKKVKVLGSNGIKVGVDTTALQDLQNMLLQLVQDYDYVKSALGQQQKTLKTTLSTSHSKEAISALPPQEQPAAEKAAKFYGNKYKQIDAILSGLHKVADRKPEYFNDEQQSRPSSSLAINHFRHIGSVSNISEALQNKNVTPWVTANDTQKTRNSAVESIKNIQDTSGVVNNIIQQLNSNPETKALIVALEKNTNANIAGTRAQNTQAKTNASSSTTALRDYRYDIKYPAGIIKPGEKYMPADKPNNEYELKVYDNLDRLASSLDELQKFIYAKVKFGLSKQSKYESWKVVEDPEAKGPRSAFNVRGRDWAMDIVDAKKLSSLTGKEGSPKELLKSYTSILTNSMLEKKGVTVDSPSVKKEISAWLTNNIKAVGGVENLSDEVKSSLGKVLVDLNGIKKVTKTEVSKALKNTPKEDLESIYANTVGFSDIQKQLSVVRRTIAIPAAKLTNTGSTVLETKGGSQRSTLNVAAYKTGHERFFDTYLTKVTDRIKGLPEEQQEAARQNKAGELQLLSKAVRTIAFDTNEKQPISPKIDVSYEQASRKLLSKAASADVDAPTLAETADIYRKALVPISIERQRITRGTGYELDAPTEFSDLSTKMNTALNSSTSIDDFMDKMNALGISATKVLRSFDSLDFSNMYDTIAHATSSKIDDIVSNIATSTGALGEFEKIIGTLEGAMPIAGNNTPRRAMHQGDVVSTVSNFSKAFSGQHLPEALEDMEAEDSAFNTDSKRKKAFITNQNRRFSQLFYESQNLDLKEFAGIPEVEPRKRYLNVGLHKQLSSLGLPESTASDLVDDDNTKGVRGRSLPMYTGNLREIAPFSLEYQQTGRNISGISSAKGFDAGLFPKVHGLKSEMPRLRSESEDKVIQAGRFGTSGVGYNVLAELRHTAGTFEDQILVSGKLADAATTAVKKLIRPKAEAGKATPLKAHVLKDADIEDASTKIMSIMGVEEEYKRRPTKAFMSDVRNEVMTNRGSSVEVQTAKLAELFLNHFGRKLTTRYGSKGVSVTPTTPSTLGQILAENKGTSVKVLPGDEGKKAALGVALMPKSMGELSADILNQQPKKIKTKISKDLGISVDTLANDLKESGNKFILDIFTNAQRGLVTETEETKNALNFEKAKKAFKHLGITLEKDAVGIEAIKTAHTGDKTVAKAIDVRISSYGAAKRGLQTEPLEMITNNLAGSSEKETVIQNTVKDQKNKLISGKGAAFSKFSKLLGFSDSGKDEKEIRERIEAMFSEKDKEKKSVQETINAMIELESNSSFYVDVIDELDSSKKRKSLVGEKFLTIVEEATQTEEWSKGAIEALSKGLKLNIPAYSAFTTIFGQDSEFMTNLNDTFTDKQSEHYDNILTYLMQSNAEYQQKFLGSLQEIDIKKLNSINKDASKTFEEGVPGSLLGTIFDTDKLPGAYKTKLPSTVSKDAPGEDFYIPRSISRTTFADPTEAGAYGIKTNAGKLQEVIEKARSLEAFYSKDPSLLLDSDVQGMSQTFGSRTSKDLREFVNTTGVETKSHKVDQDMLDTVKKDLLGILEDLAADGQISKDPHSLDKFTKTFYNRGENSSGKLTGNNSSQMDLLKHLQTPEGFGSPTALAAMKNLLVGTGKPGPDQSVLGRSTDKATKLKIMERTSAALNGGNTDKIFNYGGFENATSEEQYDFQVSKRQQDLEDAKANYNQSLKRTMVGKQGSVARTYFTRNLPAVLAKAVNATVDKTEELTAFSEALSAIEGVDLSSELGKISTLTSEHASNVEKYRNQGMPVLKQHEIGMSEKMAEKLKVNFTKKYDEESGMPLGKLQKETNGSLKDLLSYGDTLKETANKYTDPKLKEEIFNYVDTELAPYVESVRFPFTGTSSVKPYKAKLTSTEGNIGDEAFIVPGAPEMDMGAFEEVYNSIQDKIKKLTGEREEARSTGADDTADALTITIDKLNDALSAVLPKYVAHAQKLDYDGDQLEIHTAKTSGARGEIYKHFKMLTEDNKTTSGKFSDYYAYDAKQPSQGDLPLSFMAKAFTKKFDSSKGYSFMDKPFTTEDLSYLSTKEKIGILASKEQELNDVSSRDAVENVMRSLFEKVGETFTGLPAGVVDLDKAAEEAASALEGLSLKSAKTGALAKGYLKEELHGSKEDTAVNAQLFKINTGSDVESMTRLMRAYEQRRGFGSSGGDLGLYERTKSGKLNNDFVVRERNTQLNEFFRFAVQKGMDVKHAGEQPIAGELVTGVTTGKVGLDSLLHKLEKKESYKDLKKFSDINEESLRSTFGRFSTTDLKKQVKQLNPAHYNAGNVDKMPREELINSLVGHLGFKGFLKELQLTIEEQAAQGLMTLSPKIRNIDQGKHILAKGYAKGESIDMSRLVTNPHDPLYKYRTASAKVGENFDEKFQGALASTKTPSSKKGAYAELTGTFDTLNKDGIDASSFIAIKKLLESNELKSSNTSLKPIKGLLGNMENRLGLAPISDRGRVALLQSPKHIESLLDIPEEASDKDRAKIEKSNRRLDEIAIAKARLDRIAEVANYNKNVLTTPVDISIGDDSNKELVEKAGLGSAKESASDTEKLFEVPPPIQAPTAQQNFTEPSEQVFEPPTNITRTKVNAQTTENDFESLMGPEPPMPGSTSGGGVQPPEPPMPGIPSTSAAPSGSAPISVFLEGMNSSLVFPVKLLGQLLSSAAISNSTGTFAKDDSSFVGDVVSDVNKFKDTEEQRKQAYVKSANILEPVQGYGPSTELKNVELLREASKSLYEARGMDFEKEAEKLSGEAQGFIKEAKVSGNVNVMEFLEYTKNAGIEFKNDPNQGMSGDKVATAWRLYKDSVIEFLINKAKSAEADYESMKGVGGNSEALARSKFAASVKAVQAKISGDAGKRSDIYTSNKVWAYPDIAKAAGVYESPLDIQRKTSRDLGDIEDPDSDLLTNTFNNITKDLSGKNRDTMVAPADKARTALKDLTEMDSTTIDLMKNGKLLERLGPEIAEAWNFEKAAERLTRLRSALELFKQFNVSDSPLSVEKKNLEETIKFLKDAENKLVKVDMSRKKQPGGTGVWGDTGVVQVPKWVDPSMQSDLHKRNIAKVREYYGKSEESGGAKVGERYAYDAKIFDDSGKAISNQRTLFHKFGESVDSAGNKIGLFKASQEDLSASLAGVNRGFMGAIERAIKWGAAATIIYGGAAQIKEAVQTLAEIEVEMAKLRMVMPKQGTDFEGLQNSAVGIAKKYGTPTVGVLESMTLYAQQGLDSSAVLDRTDTSMMAVNVTTLKAKEATEALTAAMKVFKTEGESSMRFLDSWSEVEALHAITANDMAEAIKKSAAAASAAGITFDQLNGIVAAIGSVTRQSGKEVGTSLRFIMRRLSAEKGPEALAKINIPTVTGEGELRSGYDVLGALAEKWKDLSSAQKMSIAQAIGGTRQYNSLLVLMENWQEAIDGVHHSLNSQGSASRRNAEMMQTYSKQVEQTKAAFLELQLSIGKVAFPAAKMGLQGLKAMAETINAIPSSFKAAGVAAVALFTYLSQGAKILDAISNFFSGGTPIIGGLITSIKDELKTASFELIGAGQTDESTRGLNTLTSGQVKDHNQGKSLRDFESSLGKAAYLLVSAGKGFNDAVGGTLKGTGKAGQSVGQGMVRAGSWFSSIVSSLGGGKYGKGEDVTYKDLAGGVASKYTKSEGIKGAFALGGLKGLGKIASSFVGVATEVGGLGSAAAGIFVDEFSKKLGAGGDIFKSWAKDNAGLIKSVAPMLLTLGLLTPAIKALGTEFLNTTRSSQDFEDSMYELRIADENVLKQTRDTSKSYKDLQSKLMDVQKSSDPEVSANQKHLGSYEHPLTALAGVQSNALKLNESIANSNINMIAGYDELGNAILRTSDNYQVLLSTFEKATVRDLASRDIAVAAKHIEALTKTDGPENWKKELKDLTKEIPVVGGMISDQIKLSPAKSLELTTGKLNNLLAKKNASPMSTVYDDDIKDLQGKLAKVKISFNQTYSDFKRNLTNIPTTGLAKEEVASLLGSKELQAGYQLMVDIEPKYNVKGTKGKVKWEDVLGAEVLKRIFPDSNLIDATKELSTANIESAGIAKRQNKVLSGDLVTFGDEAADKFNMSGNQAIVKLKETSDGIFEWVATYFNSKTLKIEERTFDSGMQDLVESILPTKAIQQDLSERIEALGSFVTGASAGLIGIAKKGFKADFNLGERFFSDITTSTVIQGDKGFDPMSGFGESKFQKGWSDDFKKYYSEPMTEYKNSVEEIQKLSLEGLDKSGVEMSTELYESIVKLQQVLMNNQVVLQYRAVFADLTKTMDANSRAIKENIAVEKTRSSLSKETSGLLKGKDVSLANMDLGKYDKNALTAQERLLISKPEFSKKAGRLKELEITKSGLSEQIYAADKSKVALDSIKNLSSGFGTSLSKEDLSKYTETVAKTGDLGVAELKIDTSKTAENTAMTVDKLEEILDNLHDTKAIQEMEHKSLDQIASIRNDAEKSGDSETVTKANKALDDLSRQLVDKLGLKGAAKEVDKGLFGAGAFNSKELVQRAFGGMDFKTLSSEMRTGMEGKDLEKFDKSTEDILKLQDENKAKAKESTLFNSKNIAGASTAFGVYQAFNSNFSNKKIEAYEKQIADLKARENEVGFIDYDPQMAALTSAKAEEEKKARMYGTMRFAAGGASGSMLLARNLGMSEDNIKRMGAGGAALGVYGAAKLNQGMTGDDLPPIVKEFGKEVTIFAGAMKDEGIFSALKKGKAADRFRTSSEEFMRQFTEETLDLKVTPRTTDADRQSEYDSSYNAFSQKAADVKFDAEWKAKEFKRSVENPNANLRENTKDSVNQTVDDLKAKLASLKDNIKTSGQDAIRTAAEKMARGEEVNLKDEASQVYRGAKIKTKEAYEDLKTRASSAADFTSKTTSYAGEASLGAFDALKEAVNKNTEAVNGNTNATDGTTGHALGGYIQKFADGGTVKQIMPGPGDRQPALLTAGEEVLTEEQSKELAMAANYASGGYIADKFKTFAGDTLEKARYQAALLKGAVSDPSGYMKATGFGSGTLDSFKTFAGDTLEKARYQAALLKGAVSDPSGYMKATGFGSGTLDKIGEFKTFAGDTLEKARYQAALLKGAVSDPSGYMKATGFGSGTLDSFKTFAGDTLEKARYQAALLKGAVSDPSGYMKATGFGSGTLDKIGEFKTFAGDTLKAGKETIGKYAAKAASRIGLKKIPGLGTVAATGFATERAASGDYIGAGLELASGAVSNIPVIGTAASFLIDGVLMGKDALTSKIPNKERIAELQSTLGQKLKNTSKLKYSMLAAGAYGLSSLFGDEDTEEDQASYADGGYTTGMIRGAGTGTSDSIRMEDVPSGSFIIPAKYANKAKDKVEYLKLANGGKGSSDIRVSNGEFFIDPEDAENIGAENLRKMQLGQEPKFSAGGVVNRFESGGPVQDETNSTSPNDISIDQDSINRFAQASAASAAFTFSRYASEKTADKTRKSDLENMAEGENEAIYKTIMSNEEEAQRVLGTLQTPKSVDSAVASTEESSRVLDTTKEYKKTQEDVSKLQEDLTKEYEKQNEEVEKLKEELHKLEIAEKFSMQLEAMSKAVSDNSFAEEFKRSLKIGTGPFEGFTGPRTDLNLETRNALDLTGVELLQLVSKRKEDQHSYFNIEDSIKNFGLRMVNFLNPEDTYNNKYRGQNVLAKFSDLEDEKIALNTNINASLQNRSQATTPEEVDNWNDHLKDLGKQLEDVTRKQDGYAVALREQVRAVEKANNVLIDYREAAVAVSNIRNTAEYSLNNQGFGGKLKGAVSDLPLTPLNIEELNPQQYSFMKAGSGMKDLMTQQKVNTTLYDQEFQKYNQLSAERERLKVQAMATSDRGIVFKDNQVQNNDGALKNLEERLSESKLKLDSIGASVYQASVRISNFFAATEAAKQFDVAMLNLKSSFISASMGTLELSSAVNKMYGGSHIDATQNIDVEERQSAALVGIKLESGKSTQANRETAKHLNDFYNSNDATSSDKAIKNFWNMKQRRVDYAEHEKLTNITDSNKEYINNSQAYVKNISLAAARADDRIRANAYSDMDYEGNSKSRNNDIIASGSLKENGTALTDFLKQLATKARETNQPISESDKGIVQGMIDKTTASLGGVSAELYNKAIELNPVVDSIDKQTERLISSLVTPASLQEALAFLKVEKSPTVIDKVSNMASSALNFRAFEDRNPVVSIYDKEAARKAKADELKYMPNNFATGGQIGTLISGPGTETSDSIPMAVPAGSFIIKAKHAQNAKNYINNFANGGQVPINVSNGELLLTPEEVANIGGVKKAEELNKGIFDKLREVVLSKKTEALFLGAETSKNIADREGALKDAISFASGGAVDSMNASWTEEDYNKHGFADEKDYNQQMMGLEKPMLDPIDLIGGFGALPLLKAATSRLGTKLFSSSVAPLSNEMGSIALPTMSKTASTGSYLKEAEKIMGINLNVSKYTKEITGNKELLQEVLSKGQAIYGEGSSLNQIVSRSGPIGIKNLVESISKNRGFADGGLVDKRNKLLANIAASNDDTSKHVFESMSEILDKNPEVLDYLSEVNISSSASVKKPSGTAGFAGNYPGSPKTDLWYNKDIISDVLSGTNKFKYPKDMGGSPKEIINSILSHEVGHAALNVMKVNQPELAKKWIAELSKVPANSLTDYSKKYRDNSLKTIPGRDEHETFAELFRLHNATNSKVALADMDPKEAIKLFTNKEGVVNKDTNTTTPVNKVILSRGADLANLSSSRSYPLNTESRMVPKVSMVSESFESLLDNVSTEAKAKKSNLSDINKFKKDQAKVQMLQTTDDEGSFIKQNILDTLKNTIESNRQSIDIHNSNMDVPTNKLIAKQFNATHIGKAFTSAGYGSNGGGAGLSIMNGTGKGNALVSSATVAKNLPNSFSQLKDRLSYVSKDTPSRAEYLKGLSEEERNSFMSSLDVNKATLNAIEESGGFEYAIRSQEGNFLMEKARQNFMRHTGEFYFYDIGDKAKEKFNKNENRYLRTYTREQEVDIFAKQLKNAQTDKELNKNYYGSVPGQPHLSEETILLWERFKKEHQIKGEKRTLNTNNNSNRVFHNGGIANNTGTYFLEQGERVLPKNFKDGGQALSDVSSASMSRQSYSVELEGLDTFEELVDTFEESISKLSSIKIEGLDKLTNIKIENIDKLTDIKIEGISELRDISIKDVDKLTDIHIEGVDKLTNIKIEGLSELRNIKIEDVDKLTSIKIEGIDQLRDLRIEGIEQIRDIKVEGLSELKNIKIEGSENLRDIKIIGIEELKDVSINSNNQSSVGADTKDMLTSALKDFDSRVLNLEESSSKQIDIIKTTVTDLVNDLPTISMVQKSDIDNLKKEITDTNSEISNLASSIKSLNQELSIKVKEINDKQNTAMTHIYSIKRN